MRFKKPNKTYQHLTKKDAPYVIQMLAKHFNINLKQTYMDYSIPKGKINKKYKFKSFFTKYQLKFVNPNYKYGQ